MPVLLKSLILWSLMIVLAIANGVLREKLLAPALGEGSALALSGILLSVIILVYAWVVIPWVGVLAPSGYRSIGVFWLVLTVGFEFLFGHYVVGDPWETLLASYDVTRGNLWVLVLAATAVSPWVAAKLRGFA